MLSTFTKLFSILPTCLLLVILSSCKDSSQKSLTQDQPSDSKAPPASDASYFLKSYRHPSVFPFAHSDNDSWMLENNENFLQLKGVNQLSLERVNSLISVSNHPRYKMRQLFDLTADFKGFGLALKSSEWIAMSFDTIYAKLSQENHLAFEKLLKQKCLKSDLLGELNIQSEIQFFSSDKKLDTVPEKSPSGYTQYTYLKEETFILPSSQKISIKYTRVKGTETVKYDLTINNTSKIQQTFSGEIKAHEQARHLVNPDAKSAPYHYISIKPKVVSLIRGPLDELTVKTCSPKDLLSLRRFPDSDPNELFHRSYNVPPDFVERLCPEIPEPPKRSLKDAAHLTNTENETFLKNTLISMGVKFPKGASCHFIAATSTLSVTQNELGHHQIKLITGISPPQPIRIPHYEIDLLKNGQVIDSLSHSQRDYGKLSRPKSPISEIYLTPHYNEWHRFCLIEFTLFNKKSFELLHIEHFTQQNPTSLPIFSQDGDLYSLRVNNKTIVLDKSNAIAPPNK